MARTWLGISPGRLGAPVAGKAGQPGPAEPTRYMLASTVLASLTRPASAPHRWFAGAKHVRRGEMVPGATLADLDHIHPEFAIFGSHLRQFRTPLDPSRVLTEFVSVHICDVCDVRPTADRAAVLGRLAVVLGRPQQVRVRIAHVGERGPPGLEGREGGAPGERVIHNGTTCGHVSQRTSEPLAETSERPEVNGRLPSGERCPMLRPFSSIYRTEISARDIIQIRTYPTHNPPGGFRGP